jgi:hypothetical protein
MTDVWVPSGGDGDDDVDMGASIEVDGPGRDLLIKYLPHILSPLYRVLDEEGDVKVVEGDSELGECECWDFTTTWIPTMRHCREPQRPRHRGTGTHSVQGGDDRVLASLGRAPEEDGGQAWRSSSGAGRSGALPYGSYSIGFSIG